MTSSPLVVFGPNLYVGATEPIYHAHAADCRDCRNYGPGTKLGGDVTPEVAKRWKVYAADVPALVNEVFSDFIDEPEDVDYYTKDIKIFPCTGL